MKNQRLQELKQLQQQQLEGDRQEELRLQEPEQGQEVQPDVEIPEQDVSTPVAVEKRWNTRRVPGEYESRIPVDQARCGNLVFLDLELTAGFYDFDTNPQILEAALIVTDKDLNEIERGHWVLGGFEQEDLERLGEFHKANFRDSVPGGKFPPMNAYSSGNGLFSDVLRSTLSKQQAEEEMLQLISRHCPAGECPLVGYSVQCDREVLKEEMPRIYRHVSHQILDVSSFFSMARMWIPEKLSSWDRRASNYNHRAVADVEDAILALRWIQKSFFGKDTSWVAADMALQASDIAGPLA